MYPVSTSTEVSHLCLIRKSVTADYVGHQIAQEEGGRSGTGTEKANDKQKKVDGISVRKYEETSSETLR